MNLTDLVESALEAKEKELLELKNNYEKEVSKLKVAEQTSAERIRSLRD